jgi:hypothetical protein
MVGDEGQIQQQRTVEWTTYVSQELSACGQCKQYIPRRTKPILNFEFLVTMNRKACLFYSSVLEIEAVYRDYEHDSLLTILFNAEDGGSIFLCNISQPLPDYKV